jgi:predicted AAA+ superfamily ATPase
MIFYRKLYSQLLEWKNRSNHKPLIIRGARQVGKSTLVREFGKEFSHFISLNLEKEQDNLFDKLDTTSDIINTLFLIKGIPIQMPALIF